MRYREIQTNIDDFRKEVISAVLTAYPGRAVDDGDPSNDSFLIDGVPVRVEADRIIVGNDYSHSIPLKDAPIAGNPPQYRDVDSILVDFRAYVDREKKESRVLKFSIKESVRIPGTDIVLEKGDKILIKSEDL